MTVPDPAMSQHEWRRGVVVLLGTALAVGVLAEWLGEDPYVTPLATVVAGFALPVILLGVAVWCMYPQPRTQRLWRTVIAATLSISICCGLWIGSSIAENALERCEAQVQSIRHSLSAHYRVHGRYPARLQELHGFVDPGRRGLRPSLLRYEGRASAYRLSFGYWKAETVYTNESPRAASGSGSPDA
jgi:hypothetical protein